MQFVSSIVIQFRTTPLRSSVGIFPARHCVRCILIGCTRTHSLSPKTHSDAPISGSHPLALCTIYCSCSTSPFFVRSLHRAHTHHIAGGHTATAYLVFPLIALRPSNNRLHARPLLSATPLFCRSTASSFALSFSRNLLPIILSSGDTCREGPYLAHHSSTLRPLSPACPGTAVPLALGNKSIITCRSFTT